MRWLATVKMPFAEQQFVFQEMVNVITEAAQRLERYEAHIASVVAGWRWEPVVRALMSLRGLALLNASVLVAELGDLHRFEHPSQLMSYLVERFCVGHRPHGPTARHQRMKWIFRLGTDTGRGLAKPGPRSATARPAVYRAPSSAQVASPQSLILRWSTVRMDAPAPQDKLKPLTR